jgi:hypothetical protein
MSIKIQAALANTLRGQARWRETKAEEYPEDTRNQRWAEAAYRAADYVETLPDNDERLRTIAAATNWDAGIDFVSLGEQGHRLAARCDLEPDAFLRALAAAVALDAATREFAVDVDLADEGPDSGNHR